MNRYWTLFKWAVRNIKAFTDSNEGEEFPSVSDLEVQGSEIVLPKKPRVVELANFLFSLTNNENSPQKDVLDLLQKSSEVIDNYSDLLVEFENGSPEQKDYAQQAGKVISRFNELVEQAKTPPKTLRGIIARKMYESCGLLSVKDLNKIPIPLKYQIKIPSFNTYAAPLGERKVITTEMGAPDISKKVSVFSSQVKTELSRQTMDMYKMKAIRLLEKKGLCNGLDARTVVMNSPIEIKCNDETCEITQNFPTFDGPDCKILCVFSREKPSGDYRNLVSSSIELENTHQPNTQ